MRDAGLKEKSIKIAFQSGTLHLMITEPVSMWSMNDKGVLGIWQVIWGLTSVSSVTADKTFTHRGVRWLNSLELIMWSLYLFAFQSELITQFTMQTVHKLVHLWHQGYMTDIQKVIRCCGRWTETTKWKPEHLVINFSSKQHTHVWLGRSVSVWNCCWMGLKAFLYKEYSLTYVKTVLSCFPPTVLPPSPKTW